MLEVRVKTLDGGEHTFNVPDETTVRRLKETIAQRIRWPIDTQRLIFRGRVLSDDFVLKDNDIDGKVLHLVGCEPSRSARFTTSSPNPAETAPSAARPPAGAAPSVDHINQHLNQVHHMMIPGNNFLLDSLLGAPNHQEGSQSEARISFTRQMLDEINATLTSLEQAQQSREDTTPDRSDSGSADGSPPASAAETENEPMDTDEHASDQHSGVITQNTSSNGETSDPVALLDGNNDAPGIASTGLTDKPVTSSAANKSVASGADTTSAASADEPSTAGTEEPGAASAPVAEQRHSSDELVQVLGELTEVQRRLLPFMDMYRQALSRDYQPATERERNRLQRVVESVSDVMHNLSHLYHAACDISVSVGRGMYYLPARRAVRMQIPLHGQGNVQLASGAQNPTATANATATGQTPGATNRSNPDRQQIGSITIQPGRNFNQTGSVSIQSGLIFAQPGPNGTQQGLNFQPGNNYNIPGLNNQSGPNLTQSNANNTARSTAQPTRISNQFGSNITLASSHPSPGLSRNINRAVFNTQSGPYSAQSGVQNTRTGLNRNSTQNAVNINIGPQPLVAYQIEIETSMPVAYAMLNGLNGNGQMVSGGANIRPPAGFEDTAAPGGGQQRMYVDPEALGQRLGTSTDQQLFRQLARNNVHFLNLSQQSNPAAQQPNVPQQANNPTQPPYNPMQQFINLTQPNVAARQPNITTQQPNNPIQQLINLAQQPNSTAAQNESNHLQELIEMALDPELATNPPNATAQQPNAAAQPTNNPIQQLITLAHQANLAAQLPQNMFHLPNNLPPQTGSPSQPPGNQQSNNLIQHLLNLARQQSAQVNNQTQRPDNLPPQQPNPTAQQPGAEARPNAARAQGAGAQMLNFAHPLNLFIFDRFLPCESHHARRYLARRSAEMSVPRREQAAGGQQAPSNQPAPVARPAADVRPHAVDMPEAGAAAASDVVIPLPPVPEAGRNSATASAANGPVVVPADSEPIPSHILSSEIAAGLPPDWEEIIAADDVIQSNAPPQPPFSDAYLSGASRKRKINERKPQTLQQLMQECLQEAAASVGEPEMDVSEAMADPSLARACREYVRTMARDRAAESADFTPERYPASYKYLVKR